ncbi:MAG: hypothetical protein JNM27_09735 [Leptospirales bacterium]|nr:hypothetical protein [Leptospirales bacterium]
MQALILLNTRGELIEKIDHESLEPYLLRKNLVARRVNIPATYVVFDSGLERFLNLEKDPECIMIKKYEDRTSFREGLLRLVPKDKVFVFAPDRSSIRHFYNSAGFADSMNALLSEFSNIEVLLPPGFYGHRHLFIFRWKSNFESKAE